MAAPHVFQSDPWAILPSNVLRREWWVTLIGLCLATGLLAAQGGLAGFDRACYDQWLVLSAAPARDDVVLIGLDRLSYGGPGSGGTLPQDPGVAGRNQAAALLDRLAGVPVRAIGLALPASVIATARPANPESAGAPDPASANGPLYEADRALARAMERLGRVALAVPETNARRRSAPSVLAASAASTGFRDFHQDEDGLVRRVALSAGSPGQSDTDQHWMVAVLRAAREPVTLPASLATFSDLAAGRDMTAIVGIPFSNAAARAYPLYSAGAVRSGEVPLDTFRNKLILVGSAGTLPETPVPVPGEGLFSPPGALPALQVDAQLLAGLLDHRTVAPLARATSILASVIAVAAALLLLLLPLRGLLSVVGVAVATLLVSYGLLDFAHLWFAPSSALVGVALALPLWRWRELRLTSVLLDRQFALLETEPGSFAERPLEPGGSRLSDRLSDRQPDRLPAGRWRFVAAARALARVQELRRFLARFVDDLSVPTLITNLDGHVVFANRAARTYFTTLGNNQIDGAQLPYLLSNLAADRAPAEFSWWDMLDKEKASTQAVGRDPLDRDMLIWASNWTSPGGDLAGWVATLVDVSGIRAAERMRDATLHFMTGELCGPVQGILALVRDGLHGGQPVELLEAIESQAQRTLELSEKFVQLAIATTHPYVFRLRPLHESVELAIDANEPLAEGRGAVIRFDASPQPDLAEIDPDMFWRAVHTLILNALRFGNDGQEVRVALEVAPGGTELTVKVRDEGPGIGASEQARLVRMFQNIDLPGAHRGAGDLGLLFVKEVAERHGGRVEFTSNPGTGTEFRIILPCSPATAAAASAAAARAASARAAEPAEASQEAREARGASKAQETPMPAPSRGAL